MTRTEWKAELEKQMILRGWSRKDLADALDYSYSHVANTICGASASATLVKKISEILGIEPYSE